MYIKSIMSNSLATCGIDDTLEVPARHMWDRDCGAVPVVDGDGKAVGMITDRDICMAALLQGAPLNAIPVATAMNHALVALFPEDSTERAQRLIREIQFPTSPSC